MAHARHARVWLPLLGLLCLAALACEPTEITEGQRPPEFVVRRGGDVVGAGPELEISDSVPGDVMLAGGQLVFDGWAGGDYLGAAGDQTVGGRVAGSVRAAGGQVRVEGEVGRNLTVGGGSVVVSREATVHGNAYLAGGEIRVEGSVDGLLRAGGGDVVIDGRLSDARIEAGRLRIGPRASIEGDLRYRVGREVTIDPAATIAGQVVELPPRPKEKRGFRFLPALLALGFLVAGLAATALFPGTASAAEEALRRQPWVSAGFGILCLIAVPVLVVILAITVVGLPLAMILAASYGILVYLARAVVALWLGGLALRGPGQGRGALVVRFLLGGLALLLVRLVPVAGILVAILATVVGLGALIAAVISRPTPPLPAGHRVG